MFYFHQRQKYTNNPSAISNFVRKLYPDTPLAEVFIKVSQWEAIPLCPYCDDRERALKSMRSGFRRTCNHPDCVKQMRDVDNNRIGAAKEYKYAWDDLLNPQKKISFQPPQSKKRSQRYVNFVGKDLRELILREPMSVVVSDVPLCWPLGIMEGMLKTHSSV